MVVIGVDPGTLVTGYGVVELTLGKMALLGCGTIRNRDEETLPTRLLRIYQGLSQIIGQYHPDELAIESAFYGKNAQSALKLGHARGVSILAAVQREVPTAEYSPREVKKSVAGRGTATKDQVQFMVRSLLSLSSAKMSPDVSDAIAVAICHLHRVHAPAAEHRDWKSFVESHPERVSP